MTRDIRIMPIVLEDGTVVPILTYGEWCSLVACFVRVAERRSLTVAEKINRDELGDCSWTARSVAEALIHRDLTPVEIKEANLRVRFPRPRV